MHIKVNTSRKIFVVFNYVLLSLIGFITLAPVLHTFAASFSDPIALTQNSNLLLWPIGEKTTKGYEIVLNNSAIWLGYANTLIYVLCGTAVGLLGTTLAAFIFSRRYFKPRNICMALVTFTMLFNAGIIPNYILISNLGLINTRWAIILPGAINVFNMVVLRTAFEQIPESLEEAAKLEGAGDIYYLIHILLPLSKATLAVIILFIAVNHWNSWFSAALYLNKRELFPLQIILREILLQGKTSLTEASADISSTYSLYNNLTQYCCIVVSIIPILLVYPFLQKYFVKGMLVGAVKG